MTFTKTITIDGRRIFVGHSRNLFKWPFIKKIYFFLERIPPFLRACFSINGICCPTGRKLILGKLRRFLISLSPVLVKHLKERHMVSGGCINCGTSCNLLFQCPQWDPVTKLCTIYEYRPNVCKNFPITSSDIKDRNLVSPQNRCGFSLSC